MSASQLLREPLHHEPAGSDGSGSVSAAHEDEDGGDASDSETAAPSNTEARSSGEQGTEQSDYVPLDGSGGGGSSSRRARTRTQSDEAALLNGGALKRGGTRRRGKLPTLDTTHVDQEVPLRDAEESAPAERHIKFAEEPPSRHRLLSNAWASSASTSFPDGLDPRSDLYDWELVQDRLEQLQTARLEGDLDLCVFLMRTGLHRDLGGMMTPQLYGRPNPGPMKLIGDYIAEVVTNLNYVADAEWSNPNAAASTPTTLSALPVSAKHSFFLSLQRSFGRTALLLSGGATLGIMHIGVIRTLFEEKLLPRVISGASVGSIIAAVICTRTDSELPAIFDPRNLNLQTFTRPGEKLSTIFHRMATEGVLYDVEVLLQSLRDNIGELTFQEAFNKTRRILNITVSPGSSFEMPRVLNYLTSPNVIIWSAVAASCALPLVYNSAPLLAKDKAGKTVPWNPTGHRWIDGSVENDLPMARISELFSVNHFLVSQVNPHVIPFVSGDLVPPLSTRLLSPIADLMQNELSHRLGQLADLGVWPRLMTRTIGLLKQRYTGDVTIVPEAGISDYFKLIVNPSPEDALDYVARGAKATRDKIPLIRNRLAIELAIDEILYRLRLQRFQTGRGPTAGSASAVHIPGRSGGGRQGKSMVGLSMLGMEKAEKDRFAAPQTAPLREVAQDGDRKRGPRTAPIKD
ncbi:acyl transferase/acyl hydrolase/lysophospholipase [Hyaloraphidium curvatum]|nr:acyl transferase/acyl hydrolase/lysophospholipase [Hyaloraphidium curvatum]